MNIKKLKRQLGSCAALLMVNVLFSGSLAAQTLGDNLAITGAGADGSGFSNTKLVRDGDLSTASYASGTANQRISVKWASEVNFNTVVLREAGDNVTSWQLVDNASGVVLATGANIGAELQLNLGAVSSKKINLVVNADSAPAMAEIEVYNLSDVASSVPASSAAASSAPLSSAADSSSATAASLAPSSVAATPLQCNWWGTFYPACALAQEGWGWENSKNCISVKACNTQPAPYGIVGGASSVSSVALSSAPAQTCNWWGSRYPACKVAQDGWGWEASASCISVKACNSQPAPYGIEGGASSASSVAAPAQACNWWGTVYPACVVTQDGWGWESLKSCVSVKTCSSQPAPYGLINLVSSSAVSSVASSPASSVAPSSEPTSVPASSVPSSIPTSASAMSSAASSVIAAIRPAKLEGFGAHAGVTGGQGGPEVIVTTGTELNAALCSRANKTDPIIIKVNGTINHGNTSAQGCNTQADVIEIKQMSNVSIIGVGTNALFDQIGIHVRDASNIIIQNVHIRNVKKSGSPISNGGDAIGMETRVDRVWIDHNWLEASGGEKDGYDSLLDMKAGVTNVTVSYNLYNDSSRAGLIGSSDSDAANTNITFHHNWYKNIEQRTPLIRHALVHVYNNYWSNPKIDYMFHAINSRMGATVLVESNYFENVNNPLIASDDSAQPGCWQTGENTIVPSIYYSRTVGNGALVIPEVVDGQLQSTCSVNVPYSVVMDASADVPAIVMANAGVGKLDGGTAVASSVASSVERSTASVSSVTASSVPASSVAESSAVVLSSSDASASSEVSLSSAANSSIAAINSVVFAEAFNVDKATLFSAAYQSISTDASAARYYITGGGSGMTVVDNQLSIVGGRFTIGHRPPRTSTTASDTSANGDFYLTRPYRISFDVIAASGAGKVQVFIDNSTTSSGNSIHGASSRVFESVASNLTAGQHIEINSSLGTATSFIAIRTESSASVVIDNLTLEYTDGLGTSSGGALSSNAVNSSAASLSSVISSSVIASSVAASAVPSSAIASSNSSVITSSSATNSSAVAVGDISAACNSLVSNASVNWRESALQTDQEIVECLSKTLGTAIGFGEKARGGYDAAGASQLVVITKNTSVLPEQQVLNAISSEAHNWIVFDKNDYANGGDLAMYRLYCGNAGVLAALDNASTAECLDHNLWCSNRGVSNASCGDTFFNKRLNNSALIIRNELIKSNTTIDGRGTKARFLFNGFKIGADDSGVSTYKAENVILTHLMFEGAGHVEDHYLDPDMIRSTGESHDIWIHKNTFKNTGDSAFDVKVGAYGITMSYNRLEDVLRASLHGSSDSRTINSQIRTTMHNNFFITSDEFFSGPHAANNTARRVPLLRRGSAHLFNNVFYNYRKNFASVRVGGTLLLEDNIFLGGPVMQTAKSTASASFNEWLSYLTKDDFGGGYFSSLNDLVTFADSNCRIDSSYQGGLPPVIGSSARDLKTEYSQTSRDLILNQGFVAGQDLVDYTNATAGKYGAEPYNSPLADSRAALISRGKAGCL